MMPASQIASTVEPMPPEIAASIAAVEARPAVVPLPPVDVLHPWLRAQALNVTRHAAALRPFTRAEFGNGPAAPSEGHLKVVYDLIKRLRKGLLAISKRATHATVRASAEPTSANLTRVVADKDRAHHWVQGIEKIWDFYLELFGQRQSKYGDWLLACDRIALDCYQVTYTRLGTSRSIPAPAPFCYMRTGFGPATYRRHIRLSKIGRQLNPFPLVQLPYHRLVNPWTLGAVLHEVSHNLQSDLGLSRAVPKNVARRLLEAGMDPFVARTWARWNREMFADMSGLLLGGPSVVGSLMDVVGRRPEVVFNFSAKVPHPTPYLRTLISVELLRRMGFEQEATAYRRAWMKTYPNPRAGAIPEPILRTFPEACRIAVDAMCFQPFASLGRKSLTQVIKFEPKDQAMVEEAAQRISAGVDPGIIPERFLIGATRTALDRRLARPGVVAANFFRELIRK